MKRPLKDILDSDLEMSAKDIVELETTGVWPNYETPEWLRTATHDLSPIVDPHRMRIAILRVKDEIVQRWLEREETPF